ncbi:DUF397 domain-containing protein [Streptomyces acidiscabies]|uniref:DUF397 domain-containing protein n=1 Tax=Streptomyces acidiscabies TaxID=42234 RepID=UPI0030CDE18F
MHRRRPPGAAWFKSSYSGSDQSTCVEVADVRRDFGQMAIRDSKSPHGPVVLLGAAPFTLLIDHVRGTD